MRSFLSSRRKPFNFIHSCVSITTFSVGHHKSGSSYVCHLSWTLLNCQLSHPLIHGNSTSIFRNYLKAALLTHSAGGSVGNIVAVVRLPDKGEQMSVCLPVIERFKQICQSTTLEVCEKLSSTSLVGLHQMLNLLIYAIFIVSSLVNFMQADVGIKLFIDLEDPTIITDLRTLNSSSERTKYDCSGRSVMLY